MSQLYAVICYFDCRSVYLRVIALSIPMLVFVTVIMCINVFFC